MAQLFALFPAAWNDARAIFARRWWIVAAIALLVASIPDQSPRRMANLETALATTLALLVLAIVYSFYVYGDTMRLADASFRVTSQRFWRLVLIGLGLAVILFVLWIPAFLANRWSYGALSQLLFIAGEVVVAARFAFVNFAAEDPEGAFFRSWRLTSGPALLPTLVLAAIWVGAGWLLQRPVGLAHVLGPVAQAAVAGITTALTYGLLAVFNPWTFRWMRVAETMHPATEVPQPV